MLASVAELFCKVSQACPGDVCHLVTFPGCALGQGASYLSSDCSTARGLSSPGLPSSLLLILGLGPEALPRQPSCAAGKVRPRGGVRGILGGLPAPALQYGGGCLSVRPQGRIACI